jgi:uncharacterized protein YjbI with pentapeptide repeats
MAGPVQIAAEGGDSPVDMLRRGVPAWNAWYRGRRDGAIDLSGADLSEMDLSGVDLSGATLTGADFFRSTLTRANLKMAKLAGADFSNAVLTEIDAYKADLSGAFLSEADLTGADLSEANLTGADLRAAKLGRANLKQARLADAKLGEADLHDARLNDADIAGADLRFADLSGANLTGMRFGGYRQMEGHYYGIRGLGAAYGNALFERAAKDQDFLDTLKIDIERMAAGPRRRIYRIMYWMWGLIDYGRSLAKVSLYAAVIAAIYGTIFALDLHFGWGLMNYARAANSWFTPYYCSIVTYTTLGFGDVTAGNWVGEMLVISEVIAGYFTLGLLLSILANTIARRS